MASRSPRPASRSEIERFSTIRSRLAQRPGRAWREQSERGEAVEEPPGTRYLEQLRVLAPVPELQVLDGVLDVEEAAAAALQVAPGARLVGELRLHAQADAVD